MKLHIIHLPHTFPYLLDFSLAFKRYGFDQITLVANGFNLDEIKQLRSYISKFSFINILDIPTKKILSHGQALNYAFEHSQEDLFCFADHDIFPTQNLKQKIQSSLQSCDVVCLGDRPENTLADYKGFAASARETPSGVPLITSFFTILKRPIIEQAKLEFNVGFEQYFRFSQLPPTFVRHEDIKPLKEPFLIDTCKALSLALHTMGHKITHLPSHQVCHFGGLAGAINRYIQGGHLIKKDFKAPLLPDKDELVNHYEIHQIRHPKVLELKRCISDYALQLIIALQNKAELPQFITDNEVLKNSIFEIEQDTLNLFKLQK